MSIKRKRIFTWHIHGSYLYYLSQGDYDIFIPVNDKHDEGYYGRGLTFPFGDNVIEIDTNEVKNTDFDLILYQTDKNYLVDQHDVLSDEQKKLPRVFLKHDTPPANNVIVVDDPEVLIVHVTYYNQLMWDNKGYKSKVIWHGVTEPNASWTGELEKGIVAINHFPSRGRVLGYDIFTQISNRVPIDLVGMGNEEIGGKEILHPLLPQFMSKYRFYLNPVRQTSFPLSVCEAMMLGMPIVALATTELPLIIKDGINGYIHNSPEYLIDKMNLLLADHEVAKSIGKEARKTALEIFNITRFVNDWNIVFDEVTQKYLVN